MQTSTLSAEPYAVGGRFYRSLEQRATHLEAAANRDELIAASLHDADHRRRHRQLVHIQREHASLLRQFLADATIRNPA